MGIETIFVIMAVMILLIISYIDIRKMELPNRLTLLLIFLGLGYNWYFQDRLISAVIGMGVYSLPFSLIYGYGSDFYDREVLGFGDVKLTMGIGAFITYTTLEEAYIFFLLSFVAGAIWGIFLLIKIKLKGGEMENQEFPFAPFISISGSILILLRGVL